MSKQHCRMLQVKTILSTMSNVASILLPFLATMLPVSATMSQVSATMSKQHSTLSKGWCCFDKVERCFDNVAGVDGVLRVPVLRRWSYQSVPGVKLIGVDDVQTHFGVGIWRSVSGLHTNTILLSSPNRHEILSFIIYHTGRVYKRKAQYNGLIM